MLSERKEIELGYDALINNQTRPASHRITADIARHVFACGYEWSANTARVGAFVQRRSQLMAKMLGRSERSTSGAK